MKTKAFIIMPLLMAVTACHNSSTSNEESAPEAKTPVTIISAAIEPIAESIELRATSIFQKKVPVKSNLAGYIDNTSLTLGDEVSQGQLLFTIKTKEASALHNMNVMNDTSLNFSGSVQIRAQKSGIITTLDHLKGDFVQEGDELAIISERSSLVFILEVPFEVHALVKINSTCEIILPDNQIISGKIIGSLPAVDAVAQTQSFVVSPTGGSSLPENLIAKIRIVKTTREKATVLPKSAVLADETQTEFWVMKLINDSTAIKISVKKGIETSEKVEITDPVLNANDRIILTGNYGLADTAKIMIQKTEQ